MFRIQNALFCHLKSACWEKNRNIARKVGGVCVGTAGDLVASVFLLTLWIKQFRLLYRAEMKGKERRRNVEITAHRKAKLKGLESVQIKCRWPELACIWGVFWT